MALTSSYDQNTKTLTVTKGLNGDGLSYNAATVGAAAGEDWFGSDVTTINATKVSKNLAVNLYDSTKKEYSKVTSLTLGKGADEVTVAGSALSITTGNGKDTLTITSDTNKLTITDFDQKNDAIILGAGMSTKLPKASFSGANVTLTFEEEADSTKTHTVTLTNGKDKLITIANSTGGVVWEQSFQAADDSEYNFDNNNTGDTLTSNASYVAGASRSKAITLNLTGKNQIVLGGKGNDTVITAAGGDYEIAGGKGNDTFVIAKNSDVRITDYTLGNKDKIQLGEGLSTIVGHRTVGDNVYITLGGGQATDAAVVVIEGGKWDQIAKESKKQISILASDGTTVLATSTGLTTGKGFPDPTEAVIKTVAKASKTAPTANYVDLTAASDTSGHITLAAGGETIDAEVVNNVTFGPSTPASIKAGQTFMQITAGSGKDTLIGADEALTSAENVAYVTSSQIAEGLSSDNNPDFVVSTGGQSSDNWIRTFVKNLDGNGYQEIKIGVSGNETTGYNAVDITITEYNSENKVVAQSTKTTLDGTTTQTIAVNYVEGQGNTQSLTGTKYTYTIPRAIAKLKNAGSFSVIDNTAVAKLATATEGIAYKYAYESSSVTLDGGKGNDYLMSGNAGANLYGGAGNDTLRGTKGAGNMYGGAGNDVFLLTGEGTVSYDENDSDRENPIYQTHTINDYWSGSQATYQTKAEGTAAKKALGSDKIQIAYDTYKTKAPVARATLIGGSFTGDSVAGDLVLTVQGQAWVDSVAANTVSGSEHASVAAHFYGDSGIANSYDTETSVSYTANYDFKVKAGDVITLVDQGVTYKQTVEAATATEAIVTASYNGRVNNRIELINAANSNKAERLVAGRGTTSIAGGKKVDTIVGAGKTSMSGGNGNDIFIVSEGDAVMDYSASGSAGKDKIQVTSLNNLSKRAATDEEKSAEFTVGNAQQNTTAKTYTYAIGTTGDNLVIYYDGDSTKTVTSVVYDSTKYALKSGTILAVNATFNDSADLVTSSTKFGYNIENDMILRSTNTFGTDGSVGIGGFTIAQGTGKAITFQQITETPVLNKKGVYASTKKTTDTMIRTFGTDATASVIAGGASTYLEAFANLDDQVVAIKGGSKAAKIVNSAKHVNSIVGGAKADTITVGHYTEGTGYTDTTISVTSGKGNDVIIWDGAQEAVVTDYTTVKLKSNKLSAGDVILVDTSDTSIAGFKGNDVVLSSGGQTLTLKNGKDKTLALGFSTAGYTVADTIGAGTFVTVSSANPHEYLYAKKTDTFTASNVHGSDGAGTSETWIINAAVSTKAQTIDGSIADAAKVGTIYGGKNADTIIAGTWGASDEDKAAAAASNGFHGATQLIDAGAGNDVIYLTASDTSVDVVTGAGTDILVFNTDTNKIRVTDYTAGTDKLFFQNGAYISEVASVKPSSVDPDRADTIAGGTKRNPTTINLVDIKVNLDDGKTVTFQDIKESTPKLTVVTSTIPGGKNYFSLNYFDGKIEIGAKDYTSSYVDLTGAYASDITVAKAAKKATIQGASANSTISVEAGGKNAITYVGNDNYENETDGATYNGGGGADVYIGGGASDTVVIGAGNDSILTGGKAHVVSGIGNNVFVLGTGDAYNIDKFTSTDKVVLASTTTLENVSYDSSTSALIITTSELDSNNTKHSGTVTLNDYKAGDRVNIYQLGTKANGKAEVKANLIRSYGSETLTLAKGDSTLINVSSAFDNYSNDGGTHQITKKVDASAMTSAVVLSDSTKAVTTFIGGSGKDTIYAFDAADSVVTTLTGGKGADTFVLEPAATGTAKYEITDYEANETISFGTAAVFAGITDYSSKYSLNGGNVFFSDTGIEVTIQNGTGKSVKLGTNAGVSFSDPVNVVLSKNATQTDWSGTLYDNSRVETFDASANTKDAVKFTATGTGFTTFTGNAKGSTVVIGDSNAKGATIDLGKAGGSLALNTNTSLADTVKYSGGNIEVTNFSTNDTFNGVTGITGVAAVAAGTDGGLTGGKSDSSVTFNIKSNTVKVTGDGVKFTIDDWTQGALTDGSTDTYVFSYTKSVSVGGVTYAYGTATTTAKTKAEADEKATRTVSASYMERYTADDLISYGDTVYSGQEGDSPFAEITPAKVAVDVTSTSDAEVNELIKGVTATFSGVGKERQDK